MKAILVLVCLVPVYLLLVLGDFYYRPINLMIPLAFVLVLMVQVAGPWLLKTFIPKKMMNLLGAACLVLVCIHGWFIIGASGLSIDTDIMLKVLITLLALGGLAHLMFRSDLQFVQPAAAAGLGLGLADVLILVLLALLQKELPVFFYISMVPMVLVLFFNSLVTFMRRPEPA